MQYIVSTHLSPTTACTREGRLVKDRHRMNVIWPLLLSSRHSLTQRSAELVTRYLSPSRQKNATLVVLQKIHPLIPSHHVLVISQHNVLYMYKHTYCSDLQGCVRQKARRQPVKRQQYFGHSTPAGCHWLRTSATHTCMHSDTDALVLLESPFSITM